MKLLELHGVVTDSVTHMGEQAEIISNIQRQRRNARCWPGKLPLNLATESLPRKLAKLAALKMRLSDVL